MLRGLTNRLSLGRVPVWTIPGHEKSYRVARLRGWWRSSTYSPVWRDVATRAVSKWIDSERKRDKMELRAHPDTWFWRPPHPGASTREEMAVADWSRPDKSAGWTLMKGRMKGRRKDERPRG